MGVMHDYELDGEDKSLVILQSLICVLREKNLLSRADIEELHEKVDRRVAAAHQGNGGCPVVMSAAATEMATLDKYLGGRYGGKHRRAQ